MQALRGARSTRHIARIVCRVRHTRNYRSAASCPLGQSLLRKPSALQRRGHASVANTSSIVAGSQSANSDLIDHPTVQTDIASKKVRITWTSGGESVFHNVWLRDHCRCAECFHPKTKQRQLDTFSIPLGIQPYSVEATSEGLQVQWPISQTPAREALSAVPSSSQQPMPDQLHASLYPWSWLYANSYDPQQRDPASSKGEIILWGSGIAQQPPMVNWQEVMNSDQGVRDWLINIEQFGFSFVKGVPVTPEDTEALCRRIAFIRETHYGGFWDFTSDLSHGDTAYTQLALGAHTDTTYFTDPAGLQLFHLLSHTESLKDKAPPQGGASLLVDGFFAARIMREVHPDAYATLSRVRIATHSAGDDATLIKPLQSSGYTIFEHDKRSGELLRVRYNNDDRSVLQVDEKDVLDFYDALHKWHDVITHKDSEFWQQLEPGTPLIFDNHRVLHGRSAFTGQRRLCGAYINHDDYRSRLNVLRNIDDGATTPRRRSVWDIGL